MSKTSSEPSCCVPVCIMGQTCFRGQIDEGICDATASCWRWRLRSSVTLYSVGWKPVNQWNTSTDSPCKHLVWCDALLCLLGTIKLWACRYSLGGLHHLTDARHVGWTCGFLHCILTVLSPTSVGLEPKKKLKLVHGKKRFPDLLHEAFLSGSMSPKNTHSLNMPQSPLQHILGKYYTTFSKAATSRRLPWSPGLCVWVVIGPVTVKTAILHFQS